jgi:TfoX/Sxy family transcriptional regulator of competence genes
MAFDEQLADRVRTALLDVPDVRERRMFGGLAFLVGGRMACGIVGDALMLRLGERGADAALDEPHIRPMDFTGKPMRTMVLVDLASTASDGALTAWIGRALRFIEALPPKAVNRR